MKKIIIVGSGISGLTSGTYLSKNGYDVEIYEKNDYAGGFLTKFDRDGMIVDTCIHWMTGTKKGTKLNKIWNDNGGLKNADIIIPESFFDFTMDGKTIRFYHDIDKLEKELYKFSEDDDKEIAKLIDAIKAINIMETPSDIPYELGDNTDMNANPDLLRKTAYYLVRNLSDLALKFNSPIIRNALLNSPVNKKFSAYYFVMNLANFVNGNAALPKGLSNGVRNRLVNEFITSGGKINLNEDVSEIIIENKKAKGIISNGIIHYSDYVISACDLHYTFEVLLKNKYDFKPYKDYDLDDVKYPMYSYLIFAYKTKHDFKDRIAQCFKIKPLKIFNKELEFLGVRSYGYDETLKNGEYSVVQILLETDLDDYNYLNNLSKEKYDEFKNKYQKIFKDILSELFDDEFIYLDSFTPLTLKRMCNSYMGQFMTYALTKKVPSYTRSFLVEGLDNFVLANQWLVLPGGTPVAATNGKLASQLVLYLDGKDYKNI